MRAHGDSSASSVADTLINHRHRRKQSHRWLVASRGPGPGNRILSGGPLSDATSHPEIDSHLTPPPPQSFPLALQFWYCPN